MAFDENLQKLVLCSFRYIGQYPHEINLWTYSGKTWELLWVGNPEMEPGWGFGPILGMVYDQNQNAIVIFADIVRSFDWCSTAYKFHPGQGWERILDCFCLTASTNNGEGRHIVTYDSFRKRAIIIGAGECTGLPETGVPITVEFDGWNLTTIYNSPDYKLYEGAAGFNPETGKTVFYGYGRELEPSALETFEYDGTTWTLIETGQSPPTRDGPVAGLTYLPQAHGLIAVPSESGELFQTWLYKDSSWINLPLEIKMPDRMEGILGVDALKNIAVYWGGLAGNSQDIYKSNDTLEFKASSHCHPLTKP